MTRAVSAVAGVILAALTLTACQPAPDDDVCVPPTPSTTGAPWVEADDSEPCIQDDGEWVEAPDVDVHRKAKTTQKPATKPASTRAPKARHDAPRARRNR